MDFERQDPRGSILGVVLCTNTRTVWPTAPNVGTLTHVERGVFSGISHAPKLRRRAPALRIFGTPYMRPHGMTNGNHILHDDKTRGEEQDLPRCLALGGGGTRSQIFWDPLYAHTFWPTLNADERSVAVANLPVYSRDEAATAGSCACIVRRSSSVFVGRHQLAVQS